MIPPEAPPHFDEPWQAQAFALAVRLAEAGLFSWADWTGALAAAVADIEGGGRAIDEASARQAWVSALEQLIVARGVLDGDAIARRAQAWREAYERTPHGHPVLLSAEEGA